MISDLYPEATPHFVNNFEWRYRKFYLPEMLLAAKSGFASGIHIGVGQGGNEFLVTADSNMLCHSYDPRVYVLNNALKLMSMQMQQLSPGT